MENSGSFQDVALFGGRRKIRLKKKSEQRLSGIVHVLPVFEIYLCMDNNVSHG